MDGRGPRMEDDLEWKTTLDEGQPWIETTHRWKTTLGGRYAKMEDNPGWKAILDGGGPLDGRDNLKACTKSEGSWNFVSVYLSFNINSSYSLSRKC